ncbi:multicopper oxidase domain-containing protein [Oryzomonas japonica]|uniref:Multicopper oxidase domain-containing protein n=1 Tax=Oryzomonas japonica TaxID=2603858 RepID=A0A7J4ZNR5_9BACT|nr:multicopper oxidase domain-containing protein [Oryzomonas japonica]KAB0664411.1 multicopper oxidase domain-containing protein [Oryzomonas japonica]
MMTIRNTLGAVMALVGLSCFPVADGYAMIDGHTGAGTTPVFNLTAKQGRVATGDGNSLIFWGFADDDGQDSSQSLKGQVQYPGPTLIVTEGATVTVNLANTLPEPVSLVFPGLDVLTSVVPVFRNGMKGRLSSIVPEAAPSGKQTYTFTATRPGTFYYQSGSNQAVQIRMGLFGAIIVRPKVQTAKTYTNVFPNHQTTDKTFTKFAYNEAGVPDQVTPPGGTAISNIGASTGYDREFLYLMSEMDPDFQVWMELGRNTAKSPASFGDWIDPVIKRDFTQWKANYWFANGRNAPDDMGGAFDKNLPNQPYNCLPLMHPGEMILTRFVNMGRDLHPLHTHGNHQRIVAEDGLIASSAANPLDQSLTTITGADLSTEEFTLTMAPGNSFDSLFTWTGKGLGWDAYGHKPGDPPAPYEYLADHVGGPASSIIAPGPQDTLTSKYANGQFQPPLPDGTPAPAQAVPTVFSADPLTLTFDQWFSGSPYLGSTEPLPPSNVSLNYGGSSYYFMWHSHAEREITNNDVFPGGMLTMMGIVPASIALPAE